MIIFLHRRHDQQTVWLVVRADTLDAVEVLEDRHRVALVIRGHRHEYEFSRPAVADAFVEFVIAQMKADDRKEKRDTCPVWKRAWYWLVGWPSEG